MDRFIKDPSANLDFGVDWSRWLNDGDTISSSSWTVDDGLTPSTPTASDTATTVWLSGGTLGTTYTVMNQITTAAGRTDQRTFTVNIRDR